MVGLQRKKQEMSTQEEPGRHIVLLSVCLAMHSLDFPMTAYSKLLLHLKRQTDKQNQHIVAFVYPAPQTEIPLNGRTDFTAAWVRPREEGEVL